MKHYLLFALGLLGATISIAQSSAPARFNYQAVPRLADGSLLPAGQSVKVRFEIREGSGAGTLRFAEDQTLAVSPQGVLNAQVGAGQPVGGQPHNLSAVNWPAGSFFLGIKVDLDGDNAFSTGEDFGGGQLVAVPYALYAERAAQAPVSTDFSLEGNGTPADPLRLPAGGAEPGDVLQWTGQTWLPAAVTGQAGPQGPPGPQGPAGPQGPPGALPPNGLTGQGIAYYVPKFNETHNLVNSTIFETNGNIGIGTTSPFKRFHIENGDMYLANGNVYLPNGALRFQLTGNQYGVAHVPGVGLALQNGPSSHALVVNNIGYVGINAPDPEERLHVNGGAKITGIVHLGSDERLFDGGSYTINVRGALSPDDDVNYSLGNSIRRWQALWAADGTINTSDARFKKDVQPLSHGLSDVLKLRPVQYRWQNERLGRTPRLGFVAQELQTVLPEVVRSEEFVVTDEATGAGAWQPTASLGVAYSELIPVLVSAVQEQQKMIDQLKSEVAALKQR